MRPLRLMLYRLPEQRVGPAQRVGAPPRIEAVPEAAVREKSPFFARTLMATSNLVGVRAYAETRERWSLWHGRLGTVLDQRV